MEFIYKKLKDYSASDFYGFHMPGHKRSARLTGADLPYGIDITEIEGFDDLHHAEGLLKRAQERAASVYRAEETHYLINGSTVGLLSAVLGSTRRGERILMARNCHKSVYNAVLLNELKPVYVYPRLLDGMELNDEVTPREVGRLLDQNPDIRVTVITSPTYDGVVSDIKGIADAVHRRGGILILDEAHGAHFGFHPMFPENGNMQGADIVIHSLHKTLPALTQTALLHMNGVRADRERIRMYLHMLQSSSPSYVLMAGIDECIRMLEERAGEVFGQYAELLEVARERLEGLNRLKLVETERYDRSKIVVSTAGCFEKKENKKFTGKCLYDLLNEKYFLQMEMAAASYIIAMTSPADTKEGLGRLVSALYEIDGELAGHDRKEGFYPGPGHDSCLRRGRAAHKGEKDGEDGENGKSGEKEPAINEQVYPPGQAADLENRECISLGECGGRVALEYAYIYPPGIPLTVPGERVSAGTAERLRQYSSAGLHVEGTKTRGKIEVLTDG